MDPSRGLIVAQWADPHLDYSDDEEERLAKNLHAIAARVHAGEFKYAPLNEQLLRSFHEHLFSGIRDFAGRSRGPGSGSDHLMFGPNRSPHKSEVPARLSEIFLRLGQSIASFEANPGDPAYESSAVHVAVWAHAEVIRVHPFEDGNGRTSRLLLDAILLRLGLRPIAFEIPKEEYRTALNLYYRSSDIGALVDLALRVYRFLHLRQSPLR